MQTKLYKLDKTLRHFLASFVILLMIATITGLAFVYQTTQFKKEGVSERYQGSIIELDDEFEIPENYPKPLLEMLLNTHNHLFGFAFIFLGIGFIFYFNSTISGIWKYIFMVEPFLSALLTFLGLWALRFINLFFVYVVFVSALLTYGALFLMSLILVYELLLKKNNGS